MISPVKIRADKDDPKTKLFQDWETFVETV
jgi:hypothetical protein